MTKHIFSFVLALIPVLAQAQLPVGDWQIYKPYDSIDLYNNDLWQSSFTGHHIVDTPDKVYTVSSGTLMSFDKNSEETYTYTTRNILSDTYVNGIWYNPKGKYLFIGYDNGNIDILYDDGHVTNLPDIRDAQITADKVINDVAFDGSKAYIATPFGIVAYNVPLRKVEESGIYGIYISSVAIVDGKLVAHTALNPFEIGYINPKEKSIGKWDNFTKFKSSYYGNNMLTLDDCRVIVRGNKANVGYIPMIYTLNFDNNTITKTEIISEPVDYIQATKDGKHFVTNSAGTKMYLIDNDGTYTTYDLPAKASPGAVAFWTSPKEAWIGAKGLAQIDLTTTPATVKRDFFRPNLPSVKRARYMSYGPSGKLLLGNLGYSSFFNISNPGLKSGDYGAINYYDGSKFEEVTPKLNYTYKAGSNLDIDYDKYYDIIGMVEDPEEPGTIYVSNHWSGLDKLKMDDKGAWNVVWHLDPTTIPTVDLGAYGKGVGELAFDNNNNLWMIRAEAGNTASTDPVIMMLPADARKKSKISKSDWKTLKIQPFRSNYDPQILVCKHSNMIFFNDGNWPASVVAYDTKGTSTLSDDEYLLWTKFVDQDGKIFSQQNIYTMAEDRNGRVWLGTHSGILEITNPSQATNPNMTFNRLKVPRNDGSGFADYLLDAQDVYSIAVDGANNKWIGTKSSGLYHVAADGDEVIDNFSVDNSYLLSNLVYRVACDPNSSSIYIANPYGILEYSSEVGPPSEDFSEVYAYPNPVRPDYGGLITITGLMDGSRVKIVDSGGNVFMDKMSQGGMVTWDGNNPDGKRVKSGVYFVYASKTGEGVKSKGAVAKIVVIN